MTRYEIERITAHLESTIDLLENDLGQVPEEWQREQIRADISLYSAALETIQYLAARVAELEAKKEQSCYPKESNKSARRLRRGLHALGGRIPPEKSQAVATTTPKPKCSFPHGAPRRAMQRNPNG